jgi:protein subunit release factor B
VRGVADGTALFVFRGLRTSERKTGGSDGGRPHSDSMEAPGPSTIEERLRRLGIEPEELEESFIRGSGPGGQKINKTSSTVRLVHRPSGLEVRCQDERSQAQNRATALERLCAALETRQRAAAAARRAEREKERRRQRPKPPRVKRRMLEDKRRRGETKAGRRKPGSE